MERTSHPFKIFPREIWELILEEITAQQDIENVFIAIPDVEKSSTSKKFSWLMGCVMPLLASNYLSAPELLICRLASRRWRNAVDISLETHPDRLPYKSGRLGVIPGDTHICYNAVPMIQPNAKNALKSVHAENWTRGSLGTNPFPGRYIHIRIKGYNVPNSQGVSLCEAVQFLQIFGREIWYICFHCSHFSGDEGSTLQRQAQFLQCLSLLPNLKSLRLEGAFTGFCSGTSFTQLTSVVIPATLETIDLSRVIRQDIYFLRHLLPILVTHTKVQKLGIFEPFWDNGLAQLFPNVSELSVRIETLVQLEKMLAALWSSPIRKICVKSAQSLPLCGILRIIAKYEIEALNLTSNEIVGGLPMQPFPIPHLRQLEMRTRLGASFACLQLIQNLEYLTVKIGSGVGQLQNLSVSATMNDSVNLGRSMLVYYHYKEYQPENFSDIWRELPKLKMLTMYGASDGVRRRYVREDRRYSFENFIKLQ